MLGRHRIVSLLAAVFTMVLLVLVFGGSVSNATSHLGTDPKNIYEEWVKYKTNGPNHLSSTEIGGSPSCVGKSDNSIGAMWLSDDINLVHGKANTVIDVTGKGDSVKVYIYGSMYGCNGTPSGNRATSVQEVNNIGAFEKVWLSPLSSNVLYRNDGTLKQGYFTDTKQGQGISATLGVNKVFEKGDCSININSGKEECRITVKLYRCFEGGSPSDGACGVSNIPLIVTRTLQYDLSGKSLVNGKTSVTYKRKDYPKGTMLKLDFKHTITKSGLASADGRWSIDTFYVRSPKNYVFYYNDINSTGSKADHYGPLSIAANNNSQITVGTHSYTVKDSDWGETICGYLKFKPSSSTNTGTGYSDYACATLADEKCPDGSDFLPDGTCKKPDVDDPLDCPSNSSSVSWTTKTSETTLSCKYKNACADENTPAVGSPTISCPPPAGKTCPNLDYKAAVCKPSEDQYEDRTATDSSPWNGDAPNVTATDCVSYSLFRLFQI